MAKSKKATKDRRPFEHEGVNYAVKRPTPEDVRKANELRSRTFNEALQRGDLLRDQLDTELRKRKLWNDSKEEEYQDCRKSVVDGEYSLKKGGIKLSEAKEVAVEMSKNRNEMIDMLSSRSDLDSNTCEGKADSARFNSLFASCLVYDDNDRIYFEGGYDEYMTRQDDEVAIKGATEFFYLISGSESLDAQLPENKFLKSYDFVDDKYRLIDEDGRLIDADGSHIDENNNLIEWINEEEYIYVDITGRKVTKSGDWDLEFSPFLDDSGKPVEAKGKEPEEEEEEEEEAEEKPKSKRKPRKKTVKETDQVEEPEPEKQEKPEEEPDPEEGTEEASE
jgi:hypothetical protein